MSLDWSLCPSRRIRASLLRVASLLPVVAVLILTPSSAMAEDVPVAPENPPEAQQRAAGQTSPAVAAAAQPQEPADPAAPLSESSAEPGPPPTLRDEPLPAAAPAEVLPSGARTQVIPLADERVDPQKSEEAAEILERVEVEVERLPYKPWEEMGDDSHDWLQHKSGEWLKGEILRMRDGVIEFDSSEFGEQKIDVEDVLQLHVVVADVFVLDDLSTYSGTAEITETDVVVQTEGGPRAFPRERLLSVIPEARSELSRWGFRVSAGAAGRTGNSETLDFNASAALTRMAAYSRHRLSYEGFYGLASQQENTNKHLGNYNFDVFVSRGFFLKPITSSGLYDRFQNIDLQLTVASGFGLHLIDTDKVELDVEGAAGYLFLDWHSVPLGEDDTLHGVLAIPGVSLSWDITSDVELALNWKTALVLNAIRETFHRASGRFEVDLTDVLEFVTSVAYDRRESPQATEGGEVPQKDDFSLTTGLAITFE